LNPSANHSFLFNKNSFRKEVFSFILYFPEKICYLGLGLERTGSQGFEALISRSDGSWAASMIQGGLRKTRLHYGWIVTLMGMLTVIAAHGFGRMAYTVILPAMKDGLHFRYTELGLLATGNFIGYLTMGFIGGFLAARWGPRVVIPLALILMGVTLFLTGFAETFGFAFTMRFLTGLGNGAAYVPAMALGAAWFSMRHRGLATGIILSGMGSGSMIAGLAIPWILAYYGPQGWRMSWHYLGISVAMISLVVSLFIRNHPEEKGLAPIGAQGEPPLPPSPNEGKKVPLPFASSMGQVGRVWFLGLVYFMFGFSYIIYMTFFAAYLIQENGFSPSQAGALWAMIGALIIIGGILWGLLSDRIGRKYALALAYLVLATMYGLFAWAPSVPWIYVSAVGYGLTSPSIPAIMAAAAGDFVGPRLAPAGLGFITLFFGLGQALGPAVGGFLADFTLSFSSSFLLASGISLAGGFLSLQLRTPRRDHAL